MKLLNNINNLYSASENEPELERYFYHTDLPMAIGMGSSSWITDASGAANQHIQYLPFGESFISQRVSSYDVRYKFTGKERDSETGYVPKAFGIGARFPIAIGRSDLSVWLSVDPLSGKYPNESPYCYAGWNPIMITDPNGMWKDEGDGKEVYELSPSDFSKAGFTNEGGKLKEAGTAHWSSPNTGATNSSGFTALPGGGRYGLGSFSGLGYNGVWWSATETSGARAWSRGLGYNNSRVYRSVTYEAYGCSVRCLKD